MRIRCAQATGALASGTRSRFWQPLAPSGVIAGTVSALQRGQAARHLRGEVCRIRREDQGVDQVGEPRHLRAEEDALEIDRGSRFERHLRVECELSR